MNRPSTREYFVKSLLSLGYAAAIAVAALGLMLAVGFVAAPRHDSATAEALGHLVGCAAVPVLGGSLLAGFAWPWREHRKLAVISTLGVFGVAGALCVLLIVGGASNRRYVLNDEERSAPAPQALDGQSWLVQRAVGFEMPEPTGLALVGDDPVVAQVLATAGADLGRSMTAWRWVNADESAQVIVTLAFERLTTDEAAQAFFDGMLRSALDTLPPELGAPAEEHRGPMDRVLRAGGNGVSMAMRFFTYVHDDTRVFASITVGGDDLATLEAVMDGARGHP